MEEKCKKCNFSMFCSKENCVETINNLGGQIVFGKFYNEDKDESEENIQI